MHLFLALLASGWVMLTPPVDKDAKALSWRPLKEWSATQSFDTAKECEDEKERLRDQYTKVYTRLLKEKEGEGDAVSKAMFKDTIDYYMNIRCLPWDVYGPLLK